MERNLIWKAKRALAMPPGYVMRRVHQEVLKEADRYLAPRRARRLDLPALLRATQDQTLDGLWERLARRAYPFFAERIAPEDYESVCAGDLRRIHEGAERAARHRVDLLGSGPVDLGAKVDWHRDYKTNLDWPRKYFKDIDYVNPGRPSDVKFPWEVSRMQWLIPLGQAYLLTGDERHAASVKDLIDDWISANPYAQGINWACTMEVALRILTWTWFFRVFCRSRAWADDAFRERFLTALYLHGEFSERHIERADINGNHFTSDAAGMVFAGLFFGQGRDALRWHASGWAELARELPLQVHPDGVDYEASTAYHRLVLELFLLPALYHRAAGGTIPDAYRNRLVAMAEFTAAYSRPDGSIPLWGDADDGRALPFRDGAINDHRYLIGAVAAAFGSERLAALFSGPRTEILWLLGPEAARALPNTDSASVSPDSAAFPHGGVYVMRGARSHIFIDCGPVGLAGRGGHGHNDALSLEAVLDGVLVIVDRGSYVYTASFDDRNRFRSTSSHNTPAVDGEEINRFVRPDFLWLLHDDAAPLATRWEVSDHGMEFAGAHRGYARLVPPVSVKRRVTLDTQEIRLTIEDSLEFGGARSISLPLHLGPGIVPRTIDGRAVELDAASARFSLAWTCNRELALGIEDSTYSPSYGRRVSIKKLVWSSAGAGPVLFTCTIRKAA